MRSIYCIFWCFDSIDKPVYSNILCKVEFIIFLFLCLTQVFYWVNVRLVRVRRTKKQEVSLMYGKLRISSVDNRIFEDINAKTSGNGHV